jgi:RNA polymerase sigma factor (sigma-70 family)
MHWTLIRQAGDPNSPGFARALNELCRLYWKPAYAYVRAARALSNEEAKDVAQEFFSDLAEGSLLARYRPDLGSFRAYLKGALQLFLRERHRMATAQKRGGGRRPFSIDEEEFVAPPDERTLSPEEIFDRQWERTLLDHALADLRRESARVGKTVQFKIFERYELEPPVDGPPTYAALAREFGVKETDVDNWLRECRRRLRELAVERIRAYAAGDGEVAEEIASLL